MNRQLLKEIATLVDHDVISQETAAQITAYYQSKDESAPNRSGIVLAILGSILIGSGIILILAHNWDDFGRLTKTIISFLPLLVAQGLCLYTLLRRKESTAWRESGAALLFLSIGACIALISQVYQVSGTLSGFLLTWTLLGLPLIYIMQSSTAMLLTIASITWWAALQAYDERPSAIPYLYLPAIASMIPFYIARYKKNAAANFMLLINSFLSVSILIVAAGFVQQDEQLYPWIFALYLLLLCIYYNLAHYRKFRDQQAMSRPFYIAGVTGILTILFIWSFEWLWQDWRRLTDYSKIYLSPLPYLLLAFLAVYIFLVRKNYQEKADWSDHPLGFSILFFIPALIFFNWLPAFGILIINVWILCLGLLYIRKGGRQNHFGILNFGLLIIGILAVCRFFDDSIPFTWRGFFFLITGVGFFVSNYLLLKKRKQLNQTTTS